jgi:hypothetical protein
MSSKNLQTSQHALQMLEHLSQQQGTGEITLFFATGAATLPQGGLQYQRLINFVDYLSRMSRGRKILFVMIGSASATGNMSVNQRLSQERRPGAGAGDRSVFGERPASVLQGARHRRRVQSEERQPASRAALPKRTHHRRLRDRSDSRAARIAARSQSRIPEYGMSRDRCRILDQSPIYGSPLFLLR